MFRIRALPLVAVACAALWAQAAATQGIRPTDRLLTTGETAAALSGQAVEFFDGSVARYGPGDAYSYAYRDGDPPFRGTWAAAGDGRVCVTFENGFDRCDTYVMGGGRLVLIIADGTRFPVRRIAPLD